MPSNCTLVSLNNWGSIKLQGDDSRTYLNSQTTCAVKDLGDSQACFGGHTDAKGKSWAHFYLMPINEALVLFQRQSTIEKSLAELKKYGVFSKIELSDSQSELKWYALLGQFELQSDYHQVFALANGHVCKVNQEISLFALPKDQDLPDELSGLTEASEVDFELALYRTASVFIEAAHQSEYVPQMLNLHALDGISFTKGCYMGQETIARMRYLGKNKRATFAFNGSANKIEINGSIEIKLDNGWRRAGTVINCCKQDEQYHGLAVFSADIELSSQLRVKGDETSQIKLQALPYSLDYKES